MNSSREKATHSSLWQEAVPSPDLLECLRSFRRLWESCYGPRSGVKMILGGDFTATSASSQLIKNLPFNHPIIHLLLNFIKSHLCIYEDCGLYMGIISSFLIEKSWTHEHCNSHKALKFVCDHCLALLEAGSVQTELSSANLLAITSSILSSKPGCNLSKSDIDYISVQVVKGFLSSVGAEADTNGLGQVIIVTQSGMDIQSTRLLNGLLYAYPEEESVTLQLCNQNGTWPILLYTCMLDSSTVTSSVDHVATSSQLSHYNALVTHFAALTPAFIRSGIRLVACQKVILPEIHLLLRRAGIVVVHRLGTQLAQGLQRLSGAHMMDAPTSTEWQHCIGYLESVTPTRLDGKMYLQMSREGADVSTLLLCCLLPKALDELEIVTRQALGNLSQLMMQPKVVPGAGCFESWLSWRLREDVWPYEMHTTAPIQGCTTGIHSKGDLQTALCWLEKALLNIPRLLAGTQGSWELAQDSVAHHAWKEESTTCLCCSLSRTDIPNAVWTELTFPSPSNNPLEEIPVWLPSRHSIVDLYRPKASALRVAFDACQAILSLGSIVHT